MISENGDEVIVNKKIIMSGENLIDAQPRVDNQSSSPMVAFTLDRYGAQKFGKVTTNNIGKRLAIVLDDKISIFLNSGMRQGKKKLFFFHLHI